MESSDSELCLKSLKVRLLIHTGLQPGVWRRNKLGNRLVLMFVSMFIMLGRTQGKFTSDVLIGWPNRIVVLAYCVWLMVVAWRAFHLSYRGEDQCRRKTEVLGGNV